MYVRFGLIFDSITCLLGGLEMLVLLMYARFCKPLTLLLLYLEVQIIWILLTYVRFWQNIDSMSCLLGGLKIMMLLMYVSFWQNLDSITCLRGRLPILDFAYVRKVLAES